MDSIYQIVSYYNVCFIKVYVYHRYHVVTTICYDVSYNNLYYLLAIIQQGGGSFPQSSQQQYNPYSQQQQQQRSMAAPPPQNMGASGGATRPMRPQMGGQISMQGQGGWGSG